MFGLTELRVGAVAVTIETLAVPVREVSKTDVAVMTAVVAVDGAV